MKNFARSVSSQPGAQPRQRRTILSEAGARLKLLIAIPALNEEKSIESIIIRSLAARDTIIANSPVTDVEITVVSDGSTDRTVEFASRYTDQIKLITFKKNRGYGAAIKEAWQQSDAALLGFLDADGTCDPRFFTPLCNALFSEQADVVLGCRLGPDSKMPFIRRVGNIVFASILTVFSATRVRDTASGMRVVRRASLAKLMPLPDGLHFTPAMSARAILSDELKISEIRMSYHEREGESKLRVGKDGLRFLKVILDTTFLYRPSRPLGLLGGLCLMIACALMLMPTVYYAQHRAVLEWMIYRFIVSNLLGTSGCLLVCASYLSREIVNLTLSRRPSGDSNKNFIGKMFSGRLFLLVPLLLLLAGGALVVPSFLQLVRTGATFEHWSRFIVMSLFYEVAVILLVTWTVNYAVGLIAKQLDYLRSSAHWL
jgi:glycosyltransferase involved in cell wall biosynthesis